MLGCDTDGWLVYVLCVGLMYDVSVYEWNIEIRVYGGIRVVGIYVPCVCIRVVCWYTCC